MIKNILSKIGLFLIEFLVPCVLILGFLYYFYTKNVRVDDAQKYEVEFSDEIETTYHSADGKRYQLVNPSEDVSDIELPRDNIRTIPTEHLQDSERFEALIDSINEKLK